jgi:hypothetical protein
MSRIQVVATLLVLSCVGIVGFQAFGRQTLAPPQKAEAARAPAPRMKYMTSEQVSFANLEARLNGAEAQGWDFVQALPASLATGSGGFPTYIVIFRRPADAKD